MSTLLTPSDRSTTPSSTPGPVPAGRRRGIVAVALASALVGGLTGGGAVVAATGSDDTPSAPVTALPVTPGASLDVPGILRTASPSVATVRTRAVGVDSFLQPVAEQGTGTGVVLTRDGMIVTNDHVVAGATDISVTLADGRTLPATVVGAAPSSDLAVVHVAATGLTPARLGDSASVHVGDPVVAIGNALALPGGPTVTEGIVSAVDRTIDTERGATLEHVLQTDAAINPGNSGGPLLDAAGRVVGINTAAAASGQNIGFAIAITPAKALITQLEAGRSVQPGYLGVQTTAVTPAVQARFGLAASSGALVVAVTEGSPAQAAGLQPGDVVEAVGGHLVRTPDDLATRLQELHPGDRAVLRVARGQRTDQLAVRVGARPSRRTERRRPGPASVGSTGLRQHRTPRTPALRSGHRRRTP